MFEWMALTHPPGAPIWNNEIAGYLASGLVLATFTMKSMRPLRIMAVLSNVAFIYYAVIAGIFPVLILHGVLLPMNVFRLIQMQAEYHKRGQNVMTSAAQRSRDGLEFLATTGQPDSAGHAIGARKAVAISIILLTCVVAADIISIWIRTSLYSLPPMMDWPPGSI